VLSASSQRRTFGAWSSLKKWTSTKKRTDRTASYLCEKRADLDVG
jgi:hypothetical protein